MLYNGPAVCLNMKTITYKISGMHCATCPLMIEGKLEDDVVGVISAQANYAKQNCIVEYDEQIISPEKIADAIDAIGYKVA